MTTDSTICECGCYHARGPSGLLLDICSTPSCHCLSFRPKQETSQEVKQCPAVTASDASSTEKSDGSAKSNANCASNAASAEVQSLRSAATPEQQAEELAHKYARDFLGNTFWRKVFQGFLAGFKAGREEFNLLPEVAEAQGTLICQLREQLAAITARHEIACNTIARMQNEREQRRDYEALSSLAAWLGVGSGGGSVSASQYETRIREGVAMLTRPIQEQLVACQRERDEFRQELNWQNKRNSGFPTRGGFEFYINEEWTGIAATALDEEIGWSAGLRKRRIDPDDERVRIRRVIEDDAILTELANAIAERDALRTELAKARKGKV